MASAEENLREKLETPVNDTASVNDANEDDDDDLPMLSSQALEALKEFIAEQNRDLAAADGAEDVALVAEDWRLSQFWYDRRTAETVAAEVATLCETLSSPRVSCIACPTLYAYLKKTAPGVPAQLLEYDKRFEQYGTEFTFYDYNLPEELPSTMRHSFSIVVADPPYLSKECLEKVAETIKFLSKPGESYLLLLTGDETAVAVHVCNDGGKTSSAYLRQSRTPIFYQVVPLETGRGEVQKELIAELLGLRPCGFRPQHSNKLGNEFRLFTSYDPGARLGGWEKEL